MDEFITIKGAREHNLKDVEVKIPRNKMVVITGISGSGKSSLAFDTIYAEGQRRYMESLSSYARQFLGQMEKPDVDYIEGLSPAISIDQKTTSKNPRSTVGTVTEIYDYLRLLYARIGHPHCPKCGKPIQKQSIDQITDTVKGLPEGTKLQIMAPLIRGRKGEYQKLFEDLRKKGFVRVKADGKLYRLDEDKIELGKYNKHNISVVVDRMTVREDMNSRLTDSLEIALEEGKGLAEAEIIGGETMLFSTNFACPDCNISIEEITPRMFSFNNPFGACPSCDGLGVIMQFDPDFLIPDKSKSIRQGAIVTLHLGNMGGWYMQCLRMLGSKYGFTIDTPLNQFTPKQMDVVLNGAEDILKIRYEHSDGSVNIYNSRWEGLIPNYERRFRESKSKYVRDELEKRMSCQPCDKCHGARLNSTALAVTVGGKNIKEVTDYPVGAALDFFENLVLNEREQIIAKQVLKEIKARLRFLNDVGLDYITMSRAAGTLSGGEAQRIRLATQIGSSLMGVLYILDEPSIGLHQRDNARLIETLHSLRDMGNTVIVVEHDEETMLASDYIVDVGPKAGIHGGEIVACGTPKQLMKAKNSLTGDYLAGRREIPLPMARREIKKDKCITIKGAHKHNLKNIDVRIPLGVLVAVTGVSGSGKSTLVNDILYSTLAHKLNGARIVPENYAEISGLEHLDKVIDIDQSPIGRTPRSNPATYTGVFDLIRDIFAETKEAKARGYQKGRFSFNVKGGRCEACQGDGIVKIEMHFLPDIYVPCEVCKGKRYNRETLEATFKNKSIADVLEMTVDEACEFFAHIPRIYRKLKTLQDVGLGYISLGQSSTTLSGGEAQRVKLATELSRRSTGSTIYILDEPTTGLHSADIDCLLQVLNRLVEAGDTVLVIEHNMDVIKTADYIIDLGPEGGSKGGEIIAEGTPEEIAANAKSYTGQFLKKKLNLK